MVNILSRYFAGDGSLMDDIEANAASYSPVAVMARNALAAEGAVETPRKRARVSTETDYEVSTIIRSMETGITGQLQSIATGQGDIVVMCTQVHTRQDSMHQKLYELTNALNAANERNESMSGRLKDLTTELRNEKETNEKIHKEHSAELKARQNEIERLRASVAHLNNTIRAKDAQLAKVGSANVSIHRKLDMQNQQGLQLHTLIQQIRDMILAKNA
jgi:chromosome segregation ATPase